MPHWDEVQVGDIIQWNDSDDCYRITAKVKSENWWLVDFFSLKNNYTYKADPRQGFFTYATISSSKTKEERVLEKIKYLDKRYEQRKQLATTIS